MTDISSVQCRRCSQYGHKARDCEVHLPKRCNLCGRLGHIRRECPDCQCRRCGEIGHSRRDCSAVVCTRCEDIGHESSTCKKPPPTCPDCGGAHKQHRCPRKHQDERAPRPRRSFVKINPDFRSGARALTQEEQSRKDDFAALRALEPHGNTASPDGYDVDASESADDGKISDLIAASDGKTPEWDYATSTYSTYEWEWVLAEMMMRSR